MPERPYDPLDILGGAITISLGLVASFISMGYPMGSIASIGPGVFPLALGIILIVLGVAITIGGLTRPGHAPSVNLRAIAGVLAGIVAFAVLVGSAGLVPAIIACVICSRLSEPGFRPISILVLGLALSALCWAIFVFALGLPISILKWPF